LRDPYENPRERITPAICSENISITLDRYGHLMPGNEAEARALLDAYLEREGG
jgi:hypothetical protein